MIITEEKADLMSSLPNEILRQIISTFSVKEAVQISSVSTAWRRSLMSPSRVNLESRQELKRIIQSLSESGAGFQTLNLHLGAPFAVCTRAPNGELHLDFSQHKLQQTLFTLNIATSLSHPPLSLNLINTLHLRSVPRLAAEAVSDLCSRVESLKIEKCSGLESVEIQPSERLRNFEISDCPNIVKVVVSDCRNINSFSYKGVFPLLHLHNLPNLARVTLDFRDGLGGKIAFHCQDSLSLLSSLKDIEFLQLSTWFIEALCCAGVIFKQLDFQFSRLKDLKMICSEISSKTRDSFACFLHITPSLEELELRMEQGWSRVEYPLNQHQNWHEPHLWKDYTTVKEEACRLRYMKKIRINGFKMEGDEVVWMDLLLHNGINLKEMIVDDCWRVARVPYSHLTYIKSEYLLIPCPHIHSYFVLTPKL